MSNRHTMVAISSLVIMGCQAAPERRTETADDARAMRIVATDEGHQGPDSVAAGLRHVRFENHGTTIHEALIIRLPDGMTAADYGAAVAGGDEFPKGAIDCSGPGLTSPGESLDLWIELKPGRHVLTCWFSHPGPDSAWAMHVTHGPWHEFVVGPRVDHDPAPAVDAVMRLVDYRFALDRDITAGERTIRVDLAGPSMHEMDMYRLDDQRRLTDLKTWYAQKRRVPPPGTALGGVLDSHDPGRSVWMRRAFVPGHYVTWCGMDMPAKPGAKAATHADAGMVLEFTVAE